MNQVNGKIVLCLTNSLTDMTANPYFLLLHFINLTHLQDVVVVVFRERALNPITGNITFDVDVLPYKTYRVNYLKFERQDV